MKKHVKIVIVIIVCVLFMLSVTGTLCLGYILGYGAASRQQRKIQEDKVEHFFKEEGYEIDIIGAYTNGREHEGPFLYGWYWKSFEIGPEVVMLYYYDEESEINGYLSELDDEKRDKCYISTHFVFYYRGNDEKIINIIQKFCG